MRMSRGWEITIKTGFVILLVGGMAAAAFADEKADQVTDSFARAERRARSQSNWWRHKFKNDASFTNVVAPLDRKSVV